jgi:deoxyribodipyrimidine photolyase-related protein
MTVTVWILGDQLMSEHPALRLAQERFGKDGISVLMIESEARAQRLPYQRKKLVLIFSAMRHYAERLRSSGYKVDYRTATKTSIAINQHCRQFHPESLFTMAASGYIGRNYQFDLETQLGIPVTVIPNTHFLTGRFNPIPKPEKGKRYVQERFYRKMRQHFDLMMQSPGKPLGEKWNYDKSNRRSLPKNITPLKPITFKPDKITIAVMAEIEQKFQGVGTINDFNLAVTQKQAELAAKDFFENRLKDFGAYEDAMSSSYETIFHSRLSPYLNLGLLDPLNLARTAQNYYQQGQAPINSVEGFIRQVVGWREFIYWQYWRLMPELGKSNYWQAIRPLPKLFWNGKTKLNCLKHAISRAIQSGYIHHIERLMIISNFCLLSGISPLAVNQWFLSTFIDAYDWVMLPNVFGMGLNADGGLIATKPYIASANYINKMSDYCSDCTFDHKRRVGKHACPYNYLYWNFIILNEELLRANPRMSRSLLGLRHLDKDDRRLVKQSANRFLDKMAMD